ncbi:hypothetical protein PZB74_04180 [Porifericola rhodea]|uniref:hypothetical protein n=1 Tax=Porifericola rhodea TaxID=930972 RepID=UPI002665E0DB|nr:hypothetical protein [Porifericola rhodea]WKN32541.1 hypothetical protein PZB74_04180 [Porifericola rhodea]
MRIRVILFLILLICAFEIGLRFVGFRNAPLYYASDQYEYMYVPDQNRVRFGNHILVNEHSMRSAPLSQRDSVRILLIGDSVIDGGVMTTHDSLAASILESKLSDQFHQPIRVLNLAAKSWGPDNAAAFINKYGNFGASLICLIFSSHDAYDNMTFEPVVGISPDHPKQQYALAIVELFDRYLIPRYVDPIFNTKKKRQLSNETDESKPFNTGWKFFIDYCKQHNIELLVYLHAERGELMQTKYINDTIIHLLDKYDIPYILELNTGLEEKFYDDNIHFNELGQKHIANILYPELAKRVTFFYSSN